jgi:transcriptional regulator with XRE-family HTH domain
VARDQDRTSLSLDLSDLLADKETAYEFLREYTGLGIADDIRRLREDRDLTQSRLAEILGTTQSVVARLEDADYRRYSLTTLQKIAEAFDLWPTIVFEPYQRVIHRAVVNARPTIQPSVGSDAWADLRNLTWSQQRVSHGITVNTPMVQPDVGPLGWQTRSPMLFVLAANDGLNFEVGIVKAKGTQAEESDFPIAASKLRNTAEFPLVG